MASYLLGVDNGSSMIKAGLYSFDGFEVAVEVGDAESSSPANGYYQNNLDNIFLDTANIIKKLIARAGVSAEEIKAVSFTGHSNGMYLIDSDGNAVCEGIYSIDKRAKSIVRRWVLEGVEETTREITQQRLWAGKLPALIKWFDRNAPKVLEKARWAMQIKDYIRFRMCGSVATEETDFSSTGICDIYTGECSERVLASLGILKYKYLFPAVIKSSEICGVITEEAQKVTGLQKGTPVVAGLSGMSASALAAGLGLDSENASHYINVYLGTWSYNQFITANIKDGVGRFMTSVYPEAGKWLVSQMSATSSKNLCWFIDNFLRGEKEEAEKNGVDIYDVCDMAVANTSPEDSNAVFLPYLYDSIDAKAVNGAIFNIRVGDSRDVIIRAIYEGIIFAHRNHIEELQPEIMSDTVIRASGGREESNEWWQLIANIIGRPVEIFDSLESRALGAALCAGVGIGVFKDFTEGAEKMVHMKKRYEPEQQQKKVYDKKYELYKEFINKFV